MTKLNKSVDNILLLKKRYKSYLEAPTPDIQLQSFKDSFLRTYNFEVPDGFISFLILCDGLEFNGYRIYGATDNAIDKVPHGFFEINQLWNDTSIEGDSVYSDYIVFAHSGMDLYVLRISDLSFYAVDKVSEDIVESFKSAEEMIEHILDRMLNT